MGWPALSGPAFYSLCFGCLHCDFHFVVGQVFKFKVDPNAAWVETGNVAYHEFHSLVLPFTPGGPQAHRIFGMCHLQRSGEDETKATVATISLQTANKLRTDLLKALKNNLNSNGAHTSLKEIHAIAKKHLVIPKGKGGQAMPVTPVSAPKSSLQMKGYPRR